MEKKKSDIIQHTYSRIPSFGEKAADKITTIAGSWGFIIGFIIFIGAWMIINFYAWTQTWDPYPFILLNLVLSCLAAIQAPIILMSQNREAQKEHVKMEYDYKVNRKAERGIEEILTRIKRLERKTATTKKTTRKK
jgi:uncharacterized membrane protein